MSTGNPYGASAHPPGPPQAAPASGDLQLGYHFERGLNAFSSQWQAWVVLALVTMIIAAVSLLACIIPYLIVGGPLAVGLFHAAFLALEGRPVGLDTLNKGMETAGKSIMAFLAMMAIFVGPVLIMYILFIVMLTGGAAAADGAGEAAGAAIGMVMMLLLLLGFLAFICFALFMGVKLMWVFPLIADKNLDLGDAFRESWRASNGRFWWTLLFYVIVVGIMQIGNSVCALTMVATMPVSMCIWASGYRHYFPPTMGQTTLMR